MLRALRKRMKLNWLRRRKANKDNKNNSQPHQLKVTPKTEQQVEESKEAEDIENQNSNMSFNDEDYVKALTNEQVEDCKEAFAVFVDHEGKEAKLCVKAVELHTQ